MVRYGLVVALYCLTTLAISTPVVAAEPAAPEIDWSQYDGIDPLDPAAGAFLDLDGSAIARKATEEYRAGNYEQAARLYLAGLQLNPADSGGVYNLACCYGLLGEAELAALYLKRAVAAGFLDLFQVTWDPDFDPVRETEVFTAAYAALEADQAARQAELGALINIESTAFFKCRVQLPAGYDPARAYPLVVGLHGHGHWPDGFIKVFSRFDNPQFIFVSPQAPYPMSGGADIGYSWDTWGEDEPRIWRKSNLLAMDYVRDTVEQVRSRYLVDDVYLLGFSQGCSLAYKAGLTDPELVTGIICFGGWLDEELITVPLLEAAAAVRVFIAHGSADRMVEIKEGHRALEVLEGLGYDVTFFEFDGAHQVPEDACLAAQQWMLNPPEPVVEKMEAE